MLFRSKLLSQAGRFLNPNGEMFISTCANAPAIDHVYHFKTVDEIRDLIMHAGFKIKQESVLFAEDLPMEEIISKKITVNYCAILGK